MIYRALNYITDSTARTVTGLVVLVALVLIGTHYVGAATITNWTVHNSPQMNLDVNVTPSQTTGIKLATPQKNGVDYTFPTTSGGVLRIRRGAYFEDIHYTSATVNSDKTVSLTGVTRNICAQYGDTIQSCGDGLQLYAGDIVETSVDARLLNWKMNVNTANVCTASGCLTFSGSGSLALPTFSSETVRNTQLGASPGGPVRVSCLTSTNACYYYAGGAWISFGSGTTVNATTLVAGKSELATVSDLSGSTVIGDSNANLVIGANLVTRSSSGAVNNRNKVVATNNRGYLSGALLCSGSYNANGGKTYCSGTGGWVSATQAITYFDKTVFVAISSSATIGASSTAEADFDTNQYTVPANDIVSGVAYEVTGAGSTGWNAGTRTIRLKLGSTAIVSCAYTPSANTVWWFSGQLVGTAAAGASVTVRGMLHVQEGVNSVSQICVGTASVATNASQVLKLSNQHDTSNAGNTIDMDHLTVRKISATAF